MSHSVIQHKRIETNREGKSLFVFDCLQCGCEIRYLQWKLNRGVSYMCRRCVSKAKPPPARKKEPYRALYTHFLLGCGRRGIPVDLSFEEFVEFTKCGECHYCRELLSWSEHSSSVSRWSTATYLDRKDNEAGYSVSNCVSCCVSCNKTKGDRFSYEEFVLLAPVLREIRSARNKA